MALDEPRETDEVFKVNGFIMVMDKELHERVEEVTVEYGFTGMGFGFKVMPKVPLSMANYGSSCRC
jgi:Fe-S cluster assembly iron-binding protein IscA